MTDNRKAGIALIAGSIGGIITMALHPVASLTPDQLARLAVAAAAVHSLAMVSVVVLFLGACGLTRSIAAGDRLSFAALVTYGFACVAVIIAAATSGFIVPAIVKHMVGDVPEAAHQWQMIVTAIFQINQSFVAIYSVGASLAVVLWSLSALRNGGLGRGIAIYGCIISVLIILGVGSGHWRFDVHGMAVLWLGQSIWFMLAGSRLNSVQASAPHGDPARH